MPLTREPNDRDVLQLQSQIATQKQIAEAEGLQFASVEGTAQDYAENAYRLLDE